VLENLGVDPQSPDTGDSGVRRSGSSPCWGSKERSSGRSAGKTRALDEFGTNLTQLAAGKLDPVGRQQEIERHPDFGSVEQPSVDWGARSQ